MRVVGKLSIGDVLADWAEHECRGRLVVAGILPAGYLDQFPPVRRPFEAINVLLQTRREPIAAILTARPMDVVRVEVTKDDITRMRVMGATPLATYSRDKLAERDVDGSANHVRRLAASTEEIAGPFVALARSADGPITLFDGMHRAAAWVAHSYGGRDYPLLVDVFITRDPAPAFEQPPGDG